MSRTALPARALDVHSRDEECLEPRKAPAHSHDHEGGANGYYRLRELQKAIGHSMSQTDLMLLGRGRTG